MAKLGCACGGVIFDQTDYIPYKGYILADAHREAFFDTIGKAVISKLKGSEAKRINSDDISDLLHSISISYMRDIFQCSNCGRIHIESKNEINHFASFQPDHGEAKRWFFLEKDEKLHDKTL